MHATNFDNIMGKGEVAYYEQIQHFPLYFYVENDCPYQSYITSTCLYNFDPL